MKKWKDTYLAPASFYGKIGRIALPIAGQQILNQGAGFVDTIMVSHVGGVGAVAVATQLDMLLGPVSFGINSGAYVAEIVRAGINAVNIGQTEAGRSLGLTGGMTMRYIVLPQAIKNILPALANEAITLLKETAIVGYAAQQDITYVATLIRSRTYSPVPLLFIALVYLILVLLMTYGTRKLERRLARSDRS
mgnify:CR=1 FL=1